MLFNSFTFAVFIVFVLVGYWALRTERLQNPFLLAASLYFYGFGGPKFLILISVCTVTAYMAGRVIEERPTLAKPAVLLGSLIPLAILFVFKYFDFFLDTVGGTLDAIGLPTSEYTLRLALPIGISFFTFQAVGYVIDVYRDHIPAERNFVDFALFVTFFPQLVAGPIERATHLLPQLKTRRRLTDSDIGAGALLIIQGFAKKVLIADSIKPIVDSLFEQDGLSGPLVFAALIGFTFQIYGDFSGYSDIARGVARLLGFELLQNFERPYWARNPSEFWRRWHITLSNWFRDYVYISLGGNRAGNARTLANLFLTMTLSGLWHGASANFVLWGAFHGGLLLVHRLWRQRHETSPTVLSDMLSRVAMFGFAVFGWLLFRITDGALLWSHTKALFTDFSQGSLAFLTLANLAPFILVAIIIDAIEARVLPHGMGEPRGAYVLSPYFASLIVLVVVFGARGGEFIYFKF